MIMLTKFNCFLQNNQKGFIGYGLLVLEEYSSVICKKIHKSQKIEN